MRYVALTLSMLVLGCASAAARPEKPTGDLQRVVVNGSEIAFAVEGAGPPLVIIHGWLGDYRSFGQVAAVVARQRRVIRPSLRLHYPNPWPVVQGSSAATYRIEQHVADMASLIEKVGPAPVDLVGHAYGGIVAAVLAVSRPDLVRQLILIEPSLFALVHDEKLGADTLAGLEDGRQRTLKLLSAGKPPIEVIREIFGAEAYDKLGDLRRRIIEDNADTLGASQAEAWWAFPFSCADARGLAMPVELIEGAGTFPVSREIEERLLQCVQDGQRVVIPGAGHALQFDAPEATGRAILEFLSKRS
jgi:pimeloyl-ACP methyl ester carboxylesterase